MHAINALQNIKLQMGSTNTIKHQEKKNATHVVFLDWRFNVYFVHRVKTRLVLKAGKTQNRLVKSSKQ
jgi:hypothetical protein